MTTVLITGSNRGIGLELCRKYRARGGDVIAVCRQSSYRLDQAGMEVITGIDVTSDAAVAELVARLDGKPVDILIHNAGILAHPDSLDEFDPEVIRQQFEVNSLGPLRLTVAMRPLLGRGATVALITSRMGSIGDNESGSRYGYRMSKAALNAAGMSLSHDLRSQGVAVGILHPGFVRTEMTGNQGEVTAEDAAGRLIQRIDEITLENTGSFRHANGESLPW